MNKHRKKFWVNLCVFAMIFVMSVSCSVTALAYSEEDVVSITEQYLSSWISTDFWEYLNRTDSVITDDAVVEQFTSWQNLKENMGDIESVGEYQITEEDGMIRVTETLVCTNDTIVFSVSFDKEVAEMDAYSAVMEIYAVSETAAGEGGASFTKAALNTIMSMIIVFAVLIFIALIIYLMRYIPVILDTITGKIKKEEKEQKEEQQKEQILEQKLQQSLDVTDTIQEEELAAVMTAAIMAYQAETGAPPETFVVRSIRRRQK